MASQIEHGPRLGSSKPETELRAACEELCACAVRPVRAHWVATAPLASVRMNDDEA